MRVAASGRHRVAHAPGPVTMALRVVSAPHGRLPSIALRGWPALLVLPLLWPAAHGRLLAYADSVIGYAATLSLVACLTITPLITVARAPAARLRWWYGNWVFLLGAWGAVIHLVVGAVQGLGGDVVDWTGTLAVALLIPMALTSSARAQKLLGPEWKRWQRWLVWAVYGTIGLHLCAMSAWAALAGYAAATVPVIALRVPWVRRQVRAWRAGGYSTGGWWAALGALVALDGAGVAILMSQEATAIARALLLA